jgi:hypothetical protein
MNNQKEATVIINRQPYKPKKSILQNLNPNNSSFTDRVFLELLTDIRDILHEQRIQITRLNNTINSLSSTQVLTQ